MKSAPLPDFYYLGNFAQALRTLQSRDFDLLDSVEAGFIRDFFTLEQPAQGLVVRMALRRGPLYRGSSLEYPEIPEPRRHLASLKERGWISDDPVVDFQQLIEVLPGTWLAEGLRLKGTPKLNKARMKDQALEIYPQPRPVSTTHFRLHDGLFEFLRAPLCAQLRAMYFGNRDQGWSEYVVTELGVKRYERIDFDAASRPFRTRADVELFHALHACENLLESQQAVEVLRCLPAAPVGADWLLELHRRIALRIARRLEREGELPAALALYQQVGSHEAEERQRILTRRVLGTPAVSRFNHRSVPHFELTLRQAGAERVEYRVARQLLREEPASEVVYAENRLVNSLFGLLLWNVVFAPVRGAFFHAFHAGPADLHSAQFRPRRAELIAAALAALEGGHHAQVMRENFATKAGILNPFVAWGWLRKPILDLALACMPALHLKVLFEWMLEDLAHNSAGFPDLVQFWPASARYRLIEVKLGADRLQVNQRRFLKHALPAGIPVSVCYVTAPTRTVTPRMSDRAVQRSGQTLELFPGT